MRSITVKRQRQGVKNWEVRCVDCEAQEGWLPFGPWAHTPDRKTAMQLADFHLALHKAKRCDCCGHTPMIARPVAAGKGLFTLGGKPYAFTRDGVRRLTTPTPTLPATDADGSNERNDR